MFLLAEVIYQVYNPVRRIEVKKLEGKLLFNYAEKTKFPKGVSGTINLFSGYCQATRPKNVGQMTEIFRDFIHNCKIYDEIPCVSSWEKYYNNLKPHSIEKTIEKIIEYINNTNISIKELDKWVSLWVRDLIVNKTYNGLCVQDSIIKVVAEKMETRYRFSTKEEESKGYDAFFIDNKKYISIKPESYTNTLNKIKEVINCHIITYTIDERNKELTWTT